MTRILTVLTPRVRKMHFRVRCINLHIKCPSFSSRYLAACVVSLRQLWGANGLSGFAWKLEKSDIQNREIIATTIPTRLLFDWENFLFLTTYD